MLYMWMQSLRLKGAFMFRIWTRVQHFVLLYAIWGTLVSPSIVHAGPIQFSPRVQSERCSAVLRGFQKDNVSLDNFHHAFSNLTDRVVFTSGGLDNIQEDVLRATQVILGHAIQNAAQHGAMRTPEQASSSALLGNVSVPVETQVYPLAEGDGFFVVIESPQTKPFPTSLDREFRAGERVHVPPHEREGFMGRGIAHGEIFDRLLELPLGSTVKWSTTGQKVRFVLRVPTIQNVLTLNTSDQIQASTLARIKNKVEAYSGRAWTLAAYEEPLMRTLSESLRNLLELEGSQEWTAAATAISVRVEMVLEGESPGVLVRFSRPSGPRVARVLPRQITPKDLPPGSSVEWSADEDEVVFKLHISLSGIN
jgi:hypothetical protein